MKKNFVFTAALAGVIAVSSLSANALTLEYDGKTVEYTGSIFRLFVNNEELHDLPLEPIIFNDRALVPLREIFEALGAEVNYNGTTQSVEVEYGETYIRMYINDNAAYVNGRRTAIPDGVVPKLITRVGGETKTMVPVRFISESIGLEVEFDSESGGIFVESGEALEKIHATPEPTEEPTVEPTEEPASDQNTSVNIQLPEKLPSDPVSSSEKPEATKKPDATAESTPTPTPMPTKRPLSMRPEGNDNGITGANSEMDFVMQGVDVSHWQNIIDWKKAEPYIDFAILSMGYGQDMESQDDAQFKRNAAECEKYGIPYGVYIYSYATNVEKAKGEADHVLRMIEGCKLDFPVYYDLEDASQNNLTPEELGDIAEAFCEKIQAAGYEVGIYANTTWWTNKLTDEAFNNPTWYKWVAQYNSKCTYTGKYTMWQNTSSGTVSGIDGPVDMNYWYGTFR
ncbi:MAG: GH25 family lysozyme [bacterium]|nr:GH25 family lysozyme [bacterium]